MKHSEKIIILGLTLLLVLCGSCLNEIENEYDPGVTPAVLYLHGDSAQMMANTPLGWLYDKNMATYSEGKCLLLRFTYNPAADGNKHAAKRGYFSVKLNGNQPVRQYQLRAEATNQEELLPGELPVLAANNPYDASLQVLLSDHLFLPSVSMSVPNQPLEWRLSYDPSALPDREGNHTVHHLYLRAIAQQPPLNETKPEAVPTLNAFQIRTLTGSIGKDTTHYVRIHHVKAINPVDTTQFVWDVTDPIQLNNKQ